MIGQDEAEIGTLRRGKQHVGAEWPSRPCRQRASASTPVIRRESIRACGWNRMSISSRSIAKCRSMASESIGAVCSGPATRIVGPSLAFADTNASAARWSRLAASSPGALSARLQRLPSTACRPPTAMGRDRAPSRARARPTSAPCSATAATTISPPRGAPTTASSPSSSAAIVRTCRCASAISASPTARLARHSGYRAATARS